MEDIFIPEAVHAFPKLSAEDISFVLYSQDSNYVRNRVVFNYNAVSFVLSGKKEIYHSSQRTVVSPGEATLIPEGNSLIAERTSNSSPYSSLVVFFPTNFILRFLQQRNISPVSLAKDDWKLKFNQTPYIKDYVGNICTLIRNKVSVPGSLILHKAEELLLILAEDHPRQFVGFFQNRLEQSNAMLKKIVENNLMQNLTLEEIAFLAHKSLSSFKREFEKAYGISPGRYIRERKLELALNELVSGKSPSEIYLDYGYESLSNFIHAFKKKFGCTPKEYLSHSLAG